MSNIYNIHRFYSAIEIIFYVGLDLYAGYGTHSRPFVTYSLHTKIDKFDGQEEEDNDDDKKKKELLKMPVFS